MLKLVNGENPSSIIGITYKNSKGEIINNGIAPIIKNIDKLPFPERDKFYGINDNEKKK